jgi:hypothetical protein
VGVFGTSGTPPPGVNNIPTNIAGVEGHSIQNPGVSGESIQGIGVLGRSATGTGVLGVTFVPSTEGEPPSASGVFGSSAAGGDGVTGFVGSARGVVGNSVRGTGVLGLSGAEHGVVGESIGGETVAGVFGRNDAGHGVRGRSTTSHGVDGFSTSGIGVRGESTNSNGVVGVTIGRAAGVSGTQLSNEVSVGVDGVSILGDGVHGFSFGNFGVVGEGRNGGVQGITGSTDPNAAGVLGQSVDGFAGVFLGKVVVTGVLFKPGGGFKIDHPLDPANKYLCHSFVESPDMLNVYSGNVTTDASGEASVTLPEYFEALNRDFCYQLTVIGQFAQAIVAEEIRNNQFTIKTDQPRVKVSWQVTGIRQDPWAVANRMAVEAEKAAEEKGRYWHPELWGQPEEAGVHRSPQRADQPHRIREDQLRRVSQLVPESLRPRVEQHLQALLQGDPVGREALQGLLGEARQLAEQPRPEESPRIDRLEEPPRLDRARFEEEWRQVEAWVQRMHPRR